jgi:NAD-dependent SIR2 family protein deacetylase
MSSPADNMIADLAERDFIVFAGAGMSRVTGVPKWRELLEKLNNLVALEGVNVAKIDPLHFPEIAQMIYDRLESDGRTAEYYETIQECMKPTQCSWDSKHQKIIRASSLVVTTNIDGVFEKAITDTLKDGPQWVPSGQRFSYQTLNNLDIRKLANSYHIKYLHGRYDEKEIILKTCDYFKFYRVRNGGEASNLEKVLKDMFCSREGIVFVGFSFGDRFILEVFEQGLRDLKEAVESAKKWEGVYPEEIRHYALLEDALQGGREREEWLIDNRGNLEQASKDWQDAFEVEKREKLERRLRAINIEVIRYGHDNHIEIEPYFEDIYNRKRGVQDFIRE